MDCKSATSLSDVFGVGIKRFLKNFPTALPVPANSGAVLSNLKLNLVLSLDACFPPRGNGEALSCFLADGELSKADRRGNGECEKSRKFDWGVGGRLFEVSFLEMV